MSRGEFLALAVAVLVVAFAVYRRAGGAPPRFVVAAAQASNEATGKPESRGGLSTNAAWLKGAGIAVAFADVIAALVADAAPGAVVLLFLTLAAFPFPRLAGALLVLLGILVGIVFTPFAIEYAGGGGLGIALLVSVPPAVSGVLLLWSEHVRSQMLSRPGGTLPHLGRQEVIGRGERLT